MCPNFRGVAKKLPVLCTGQFGALDGRSPNVKFIQSLECCVGHDRIFNPINFTYYTRYIFCRAWSKMLNFSDDGGPRPEKATILWKWLMEHIANSRKNGKSVSGMRVCSEN